MRLWLGRAVLLLGLLALAAALHHLLAPAGLGWVVGVGLVVVVAVLFGELGLRLVRRRRERGDWARWRAAVVTPSARPAAMAELRDALEGARRRGGRTRLLQARLAIALSELCLAADDSESATRTLSTVPVGALGAKPAALVRLARAQAYLHRGDAEEARATLVPIGALDDPVLEASRELARAGLALVEGDAAEASRRARAVLARAHPDDDLYAEALVLAAAAHDPDAQAKLDGLPAVTLARARALAPAPARRVEPRGAR